jgi:hypothetical protein
MENLYLIKCNEFYKIGIANDLQSRLAQLQTGNPYALVVEACFEFPNAGIVEKALHQKFAGVRTLGEWFSLGNGQVDEFLTLCRVLGGSEIAVRSELVDQEELEEAEEIQEAAFDRHTNGSEWDYAAMFADGWRLNVQDSRRLYWNWRRGSDNNRQTIYGGVVSDLPYSLEDMRRIYRDGEKP